MPQWVVDGLKTAAETMRRTDAVANKVDRACVAMGQPPEERAYWPHITLARFGRSGALVDPFLASHAALNSPPFTIDSFALFESRLGNNGAHYQIVEDYGPGSPD